MTAALVLEAELLAHLQLQLVSARRLLGLVLEQGAAIRARDAQAVIERLTRIQTEMGRRGALEGDRARLLQRAGVTLGAPASQVTLERLCSLITPEGANAATERSAELRGLLAEIAREHGMNRALMRKELAFLSPLTRLIGREPEPGYRPPGSGSEPAAALPGAVTHPRHTVDYEA